MRGLCDPDLTMSWKRQNHDNKKLPAAGGIASGHVQPLGLRDEDVREAPLTTAPDGKAPRSLEKLVPRAVEAMTDL